MELAGKEVGKFVLTRLIGEGGMGEVYAGFDKVLKREVAVKVLSGIRKFDEKEKSRFTREAEILSQLEHPRICRIYDYISEDNYDYLILEFIRGKDLKKAQLKGLSFKEKLKVAIQIAEVLSITHEKGIVHRDLKPTNVMLDENGDIKLLDFGMARTLTHDELATLTEIQNLNTDPDAKNLIDKYRDSGKLFITQEGAISGTPMFMSPEQANGLTATPSSDMYSFGLFLQWLFTEKYPYPENEMPINTILKVIHGNTLDVENIDPDLIQLINRLKSIKPENRPYINNVLDQLKWIQDKPVRRRNMFIVSAFLLLFMIISIISTTGYFQIKKAKEETQAAFKISERAREQAETINQFLTDMLGAANPMALGKDVKVVEVLDFASENVEDEFRDFPLNKATVYHTLAVTFLELSEYSKAQALIEKAIEIRNKELGELDRDTLVSRRVLAQLLDYQGKYQESETLYRTLIKQYEASLGLEAEETIMARGDLATLLYVSDDKVKLKEAESILLKNIELRKKKYGLNHISTLTTMNNLASNYFRHKRYQEAENLLKETIENAKCILPETHPLILGGRNNLANTYLSQEKYDKAANEFSLLLTTCEQVLGRDHTNTLIVKGHLAMVKYSQGQMDEAEKLFRETYEARKRVLGEQHPMTQQIEILYAKCLLKQNKDNDAEKLLHEALSNGNSQAQKILDDLK